MTLGTVELAGTDMRITRVGLGAWAIGGTLHMALGAGYPDTGSHNQSAVHWDMICDLRRGGRLTVDGEPLLEDGRLRIEGATPR